MYENILSPYHGYIIINLAVNNWEIYIYILTGPIKI